MRTQLFGHPVDVLSMEETVQRIRSAMANRTPLHHVALNVAKLVELNYNDELREDVHAADIVGIDGMGILLALRLKAIEVPERVAGIDLMHKVLEMCAAEGFKPFFLGAESHIVTAAAEVAKGQWPDLAMAGVQHGYFKAEDEAAIVEKIHRSGADCLFVGMPTPRKERFLAKYRNQLKVPFIMGVGGSFDVMAGKVERAPTLMQRLGLEWLYRVYQEPRRMWWRYARTNTLFAGMLGADFAARVADHLTLATNTRHSTAVGSAASVPSVDARHQLEAVSVTVAATKKDTTAGGGRPEPVRVAEGALPFKLPWRVVTDALIALELASILVASQLAILLYDFGPFSQGLRDVDYILPSLVCALVVGYQLNGEGLLTLNAILERQTGEWRKLLVALGQGFLLTVAIGYILQVSVQYSRGWLLYWLILSCVLILAMRQVNRHLLRWLLKSRAIERRVAVVSSGTLPPELLSAILAEPSMTLARHHVITPGDIGPDASLDADARAGRTTAADPGDPLEILVQRLIRDDVEEVLIVDRGFTSEQLSRIVRHVNMLPINVFVQPTVFSGRIPILDVERIRSGSLLKVSGKPLGSWSLVVKNLVDFALAAIALVVLLPLMLPIALLIKLDSKGPVFFRQRRQGFYGNEIVVYKFRTMHVLEDAGVIKQAQRNDSRVTRVGWWLRRTSLDELPQLINVVRGEMSLVGPRPHALQHDEMFRQCVNRYSARHRVKPGITGLSQINGLRGECETIEKMRKRVEMDIYYIDNWSFWLDLRILVLTPFFGLVNRNAY